MRSQPIGNAKVLYNTLIRTLKKLSIQSYDDIGEKITIETSASVACTSGVIRDSHPFVRTSCGAVNADEEETDVFVRNPTREDANDVVDEDGKTNVSRKVRIVHGFL